MDTVHWETQETVAEVLIFVVLMANSRTTTSQAVQNDRYQLCIEELVVDVVKKRMKTMRLRVLPPDGRVTVSAPRRVSKADIGKFVIEKADWIRRKQQLIQRRHPNVPNNIVAGEFHPVQGRPHKLVVLETKGRREVKAGPDGSLSLFARPGDSVEKRRTVLEKFYRQLLGGQLPHLIAKWEPIVGVDVAEWRIRRMKTRWGSCNIRARRIWLNLELAKRAPECLEFVLVHEMVHLHERYHNKRFYSLMDQFMPDWRRRREELRSQAPVD